MITLYFITHVINLIAIVYVNFIRYINNWYLKFENFYRIEYFVLIVLYIIIKFHYEIYSYIHLKIKAIREYLFKNIQKPISTKYLHR